MKTWIITYNVPGRVTRMRTRIDADTAADALAAFRSDQLEHAAYNARVLGEHSWDNLIAE